MVKLIYTMDYTAAPLDLAAQALTTTRLQEFAARTGLSIEEVRKARRREFALVIPPNRLNDVLWDLDLAGLLLPTQQITGPPGLHASLEERFATLTWVDAPAGCC
jgi:hypothetical protein